MISSKGWSALLLLVVCLFLLTYPVAAQETATITITGVIKEPCDGSNSDDYGGHFLKPPVAKFSVRPLVGRSSLWVTFKDQSLRNPVGYLWSFGDDTYSSQKNPPAHEYTKPGFHTIQLTVWNSAGRDNTTEFIYVLPKKWWLCHDWLKWQLR